MRCVRSGISDGDVAHRSHYRQPSDWPGRVERRLLAIDVLRYGRLVEAYALLRDIPRNQIKQTVFDTLTDLEAEIEVAHTTFHSTAEYKLFLGEMGVVRDKLLAVGL